MLVEFTAWRLLTSPARLLLGRRLLWRGRRAFIGVGLVLFFAVAGPSALYLIPSATLLFPVSTIALIAVAVLSLWTPVGRVLLTAGAPCSAGSSSATAGGPESGTSECYPPPMPRLPAH